MEVEAGPVRFGESSRGERVEAGDSGSFGRIVSWREGEAGDSGSFGKFVSW